jgi:dienelactone hydrolase
MLGIIALIPGVDLLSILASSSNDRVRNTLRLSVDGNISIMQRRSPAQLLDQYKAGLPFVIFYNSEDSLLMADKLEAFIADLRRRLHPVTTFSAPGDHNFIYTNFDFKVLVESLGSDSTETAPPPLISNDERTGLQTLESGG